ncbi:flagellar hook-associated protein FlgL [Marinobacterium mangrovicola]|uniref:Flagellar hook-associated protein 3 n=1 Tax=Marinobacterium mangrovicola TaxID=1476959 RepID=A0A4V2PE00_9GAMM|nr:flagellar hook-associated protein FlgL [Marinobacterium mangrovicola]TCK07046.1 flagellar hook-associated protein 3 [Marinobacterium mangrovicola]
MRISTGQIYTNANQNMMENQSSLADIQNKLASGKEFTSLAEDPVGASRVVSLQRELAQLEMYQGNVDASRRRLQLEETTIGDLNTATDRMRELVLQAANGTMSDPDRVAISYELEDLVEYAAGLMNTRDAKGEYLFSGSQGSTQTYVKGVDGRYEYMGDSSSRSIQVSSALYAQSTDSGQFLFESVLSEAGIKQVGGDDPGLNGSLLEFDVTDAEAYESFMREHGDLKLSVTSGQDDGSGTSVYRYALIDSAGQVLAEGAYDETAAAEDRVETFELEGISFQVQLPDSVDNPDYSISNSALIDSVAISDNQAYSDLMRLAGGEVSIQTAGDETSGFTYSLVDSAGDPVSSLAGVTLSGTPPQFTVSVDSGAGSVPALDIIRNVATDDTNGPVTLSFIPADETTLQFDQPPTNILNEMLDTVELMREPIAGYPEGLAKLQERFALTLDQLTMSQERLSEANATVGSRLNKLDNAESSNMDFQLMAESTLSSVQDLDYAAASTELAKRQLALEAAYASFNRIQSLSLFDYIR